RRSFTRQNAPRSQRRHRVHRGHAERLAQPFVISENKGAAFLDRQSCRASKLIALEGGNDRAIKKIACVESAVAEKFVQGSVESILAGAGHPVDHAAGSSAIFGGIVAPENGNLLDRVNTKIVPEHA